jgi:GLPGLI family protein
MKKIFLIYCLYLSICNVCSQNISFIYELKYKPNSNKDYLKEELFYLDISDKESIFRSEHERSSDSLIQKTGYGLGFKIFYNHQYYTQKIWEEKKVYKIISTPIFIDIYSLPIENLDWEITQDKLKIGNFNCQKANLKYGGRNWTAWFAQEIPLQEGPYIFNGLPGLIIKISDATSDYHFELVKIKKNLSQISHLKPKKEITWETLKKLETDFYNEPYAEVKARNIGYVNANEKGEKIDISMKKMTESMQKNIRDNDNSIELDQAVKYD